MRMSLLFNISDGWDPVFASPAPGGPEQGALYPKQDLIGS